MTEERVVEAAESIVKYCDSIQEVAELNQAFPENLLSDVAKYYRNSFPLDSRRKKLVDMAIIRIHANEIVRRLRDSG